MKVTELFKKHWT